MNEALKVFVLYINANNLICRLSFAYHEQITDITTSQIYELYQSNVSPSVNL